MNRFVTIFMSDAPKAKLTAEQAAELQSKSGEAGAFLESTASAAAKDFETFVKDDTNLANVYSILQASGSELVGEEKFPEDAGKRGEIRTHLNANSGQAVKEINAFNESFKDEEKSGGLGEWLVGLYKNSPAAFSIGAAFLGNMLHINPELIQVGLAMLKDMADGKDNGPEVPVKGGEASKSGNEPTTGQKTEATAFTLNTDVAKLLADNGGTVDANGKVTINRAPAASYDPTVVRQTQRVEAGVAGLPLGT